MGRLRRVGMGMQVIYSDQEPPTNVTKTIFLAGPTPRSNDVDTWRPKAIQILQKLGYDGHVFVPEPSNGEFSLDYDAQVGWELEAMNRADVIVFWIPRVVKNLEMPAFTTNVEFGMWVKSGNVALGSPPEADKMAYIETLAERNNVKYHTTLDDTLREALERIGDGAERTGGEVEVPLLVWKTSSFQNWYQAQTKAGNRLDHAEVKYTHRVGPNHDIIFLWALWVDMFIASENRHKVNEITLSRTDTSSVVMYHANGSVRSDTDLVLVSEFRSPASTQDGFIWEIPGGSSLNSKEKPEVTAAHEVEEETGLKIEPSRITYHGARQSAGTLLANKIHMFSVELTGDEIEWIRSQEGIPKGIVEDSERTYVHVWQLKDIFANTLLDWSNVGMVCEALIQY